MKKLGIVVGILVLIFVASAAALPFLIDVDKFRPQIEKAVNDHINGEFKLGKLQLSLWSGLEVKVGSLSLKGKGAPKPMLETTSAYLEVPFLSILTFHPSIVVVLAEPKVDLVKDANGKLNILALLPEAGTTPAPAAPAPPSSGIPGIAASFSLGFRIDKGVFHYADASTGNKISIDGMDLDIKNLGLASTMEIHMKVPMEGNMGGMQLNVPIQINGTVTPVFSDTGLKTASEKIAIQIDQLALAIDGSEAFQPQMSVKVDVHTTKVDLADVEKIVPMVKDYALAGMVNLQVHIEGPTSQLAIHGDLDLQGGKAAYPKMLKAPIGFDVKSSFTEKTLDLAGLTVTAPGTNMTLKGEVKNFLGPQFNFTLNAKEIDVDKLLKTETVPAKTAFYPMSLISEAEAAPAKHKAAAVKKAEAAPVNTNTGNPMLPLAKNPTVANAAGTFTANIGKLTAKGAAITDVGAKVELKNMVLTVESFSLKAFDGTMSTNAVADLKAPGLTFKSTGKVAGMSAKAALTAFVPKFQNTLEGKTSANWSMSGAAYPQPQLMHSLGGTVTVAAENGKLHTIDLQDSFKSIMAKVPFLSGKNPPPISEDFKIMHADMKFAGGVITVDPLELVGQMTIKGKSKILENMTQDTYVDVYDPNKLLPSDISDGKNAAMQLHITGPVSSPQTDYGYTVSKLAKNVVRNRGSQMLGDALGKAIGSKTGTTPGSDKTQEAVKGVLKGLGF